MFSGAQTGCVHTLGAPNQACLGCRPFPCLAALVQVEAAAKSASISSFPFCKNWKTAVATSTLPGFLSGCHCLRSARNSFMRASLGSTSRNCISFVSASALAFSTSGQAAAADSRSAAAVAAPVDDAVVSAPPAPPGPLASLPLSLSEELALLSAEPLSFFLLFFLFRLLPLLERSSEEEEFLLRRLRLRERLTLPLLLLTHGGTPRLPFNISRMAREPACGESERLGISMPMDAWYNPPSILVRGRNALHLKHSKRFTKLRSEQFSHHQSRLRSSSPSFPPKVLLPTKGLIPLEPLPLSRSLFAPWRWVTSPTGRKFRACSFPSGKRCTSNVTLSPARSDVCSCGWTLSREK